MLQQKSDLILEEMEPLHFTDSSASATIGARRRLASKSPVDRNSRLTGSSFSSQEVTNHEHSESVTPLIQPLNRLNILKNSTHDSSRTSFRSIPSIAESFVADTDYHRVFYSKDNNKANLLQEKISADKAGRFCAIFSLVGMLFLIFVGTLIEVQPFYVKGIKGSRPTRARKMKKLKYTGRGYITPQFWIGLTDRGRSSSWSIMAMRFLRYTNDDDAAVAAASSGKYKKESQGSSNNHDYTETVYQLRRESRNAFKAAAAYFLFMVLSIIYILNQDVISFDMVYWYIYIRHHVVLAYKKYLRREYVDIPDSSSVCPILPAFQDDTMAMETIHERRDSMRKARSLSSLELKNRRLGIRSHSMRPSNSKDKEK